MLAIKIISSPKNQKNGASIRSHRFFLGVDLGLRFRILSSLDLHNPTSPR